MNEVGLDPGSLGLVRKSNVRPDPRFTAVGFDGSIIWALHPKHFNPATLMELQKPYRDEGLALTSDAELYVRSVSMKGYRTHGETTSVSKEFVPIYADKNIISKENPYDYAQYLENLKISTNVADYIKQFPPIIKKRLLTFDSTEEDMDSLRKLTDVVMGMTPWKLAYHPTMTSLGSPEVKVYELDLADIPGIDMDGGGSITVSGSGGASISYPLPQLVNSGNTKIKLTWIADHFSGFWYELDFGGRVVQGKYSGTFIQSAIITEYSEHMVRNIGRELGMLGSELSGAITGFVKGFKWNELLDAEGKPIPELDIDGKPTGGSTTGTGLNMAGGASSLVDVGESLLLRQAMFEDMKRSSRNVGGEFIYDTLGEEVDMLLNITYPISNELTMVDGSTFKPKDFAVNEPKTFQLNSRYNGMDDVLTTINTNFQGELVAMDVDLVFNYGSYNEYFSQLVNKGALL